MFKSILLFFVFVVSFQLSAQEISLNQNPPTVSFGQLTFDSPNAVTITQS